MEDFDGLAIGQGAADDDNGITLPYLFSIIILQNHVLFLNQRLMSQMDQMKIMN